jgi:hypothetical protein
MCYAFRRARNRLHAHNEFRQAYTVCVQVYTSLRRVMCKCSVDRG